jgi:hypothetical protein
VDDLGIVEADHGLGEGVVVAVADAADGRLVAGLEQPLGVFDRDALGAAVAVVYRRDKWTPLNRGLSNACRADRRQSPAPNDSLATPSTTWVV